MIRFRFNSLCQVINIKSKSNIHQGLCIQNPSQTLKRVHSQTIPNIINHRSFSVSNLRYFFSSDSFDNKKQPNKFNFNAYMRLCRWHQPIGAMLLYWPTAWGVCVGSQGIPSVYLLLLFLMGSWTSRSAGCIVNDYLDKDIDKMVQRTKNRPLASGEVTPKQAAILLFLNLCGGLFVLFNLPIPALITTLGFVFLSAIYPLAKRYTKYPQLVLGLAFNSGILIGCLTASPSTFVPAMIPIYLGAIAWTMIYDTVYAFQDLQDDIKIGVKSTAVTWHNKNPIKIMEQFALIIGMCHLFLPFFDVDYQYSFMIMLALDVLLFLQIRKLNLKNKASCAQFFKRNNLYGFGIFVALVLYGFVKQLRSYGNNQNMIQK